jgi:nitronate monooxygenase
MTISTSLTQRLGIEHPVMLAPMGFVSGGALAAAVSAAGGFGIIGGGYADPDWLEREFVAAGNIPVGCGFITWALAERPESLDVAISHQPAAIMLSFGDAGMFLPKIKNAGVLAICQVQTLTQARTVLAEGADIIIAQGTEAGGHGGGRSTLPLVPAVVDMVANSGRLVPVVAAGGITDGRGLAAALMLGADGVVMGTRFAAASESLYLPGVKARIVAASGDDTLRTTIFDIARGYTWPKEYTGRAVRNQFVEEWHGREGSLTQAENERDRYAEAAARGDADIAVVFAGEGIDLIHAVEPRCRHPRWRCSGGRGGIVAVTPEIGLRLMAKLTGLFRISCPG